MLVVYGIGLCERPILMKFDKGGISSNGKKFCEHYCFWYHLQCLLFFN